MYKYIDLLVMFLDCGKIKLIKDMKGDEGEWRRRRRVIKKAYQYNFLIYLISVAYNNSTKMSCFYYRH
jgi:hypothetical protein